MVQTGMGMIQCRKRDLAVGSKATLCIRPEFIRITSRDQAEGQNVMQGIIESLEFVGEVYEAEIIVGQERLLARIEPDVKLRQGEQVSFTLDPDYCMLLSV
jgi:iron(III) transport system ATP-binding protein